MGVDPTTTIEEDRKIGKEVINIVSSLVLSKR